MARLARWLPLALSFVLAPACSDGRGGAETADAGDGETDGRDLDGASGDPGPADDGEADPSDPGPADAGDELDAGDGAADGDVGGDPGQAFELTVLSFNLKHPLAGMDDALARLPMVAELIDARQPDLVALQEVVRKDDEPDLAAQLAGLTGYEWYWEYTYDVPLLFTEGIAVLSRWPIVWHESVSLPHVDMLMFTREALGTRVATPRGEIQLFCTHMTTDSSESVKADQALAVLEHIRAHPSPLPGFLAGDLNAEPDTLAMRFLRGEAEHQGATGDLTDSWLVASPGQDGFTIPSHRPERRIDYIYVIPGQAGTARPVECEIVLDQPAGGVYASDHLGVLCRYELD